MQGLGVTPGVTGAVAVATLAEQLLQLAVASQEQLLQKVSGVLKPADKPRNSTTTAAESSDSTAPGPCIGFLEGTDTGFIATLQTLGFCVKGPLSAPVDPEMVEDALNVILDSEVALNFEPLRVKGFIQPSSYWYPMVLRGQLIPTVMYLKAQRIRGALMQQVEDYFRFQGISVLAKPPRTTIGLDGFATLLGLPEVVLPVGIAGVLQSGDSNAAAAGSSIGGGAGAASSNVLPQPKVVSLIALAGEDAKAVAVGAAYQGKTKFHLQRPPVVGEEYQRATPVALSGR
jgi:hypothetical protein